MPHMRLFFLSILRHGAVYRPRRQLQNAAPSDAQYDPDFAAALAGLLDEKVIKPADRALFDFLPERVN